MIELISNAAQLLVTLTCCGLSIAAYIRSRHQAYFPLACFYGCFALAGLYWTLYLLLYRQTPHTVSVAYVGWNTSLVFLYILQDMLAGKEERSHKSRLCWLVPALGVPIMAVICYGHGSLSRLIACSLILLIAWQTVRGLAYARGRGNKRWLHIALLAYAVTEYTLWTVACFIPGNGWSAPYIWVDFLLTASLAAIYPSARKAVGA